MAQQRANGAIETYLALARSLPSPRVAADLIVQATSATHTYVFAELLQEPTIQALSNSQEYRSYVRLLEIFAWGTFAEYKATPGLPDLNVAQREKLLMLSLLPLCSIPVTCSYSYLCTALFLASAEDLERLITRAIYNNLITAHLDPLCQTVRVVSVSPLRDLSPGVSRAMVTLIEDWERRCFTASLRIEHEITSIRTKASKVQAQVAADKIAYEHALGRLNSEKGGRIGSAWPTTNTDSIISEEREVTKDAGSRSHTLSHGRGGKRSAPMDIVAKRLDEHNFDAMDLDSTEDTPSVISRSTKRKSPR